MKTKVEGAIYLMRHGRTALDLDQRSDGWLDMPLSSDGELSIIGAQQRLKAEPLAAIYAPSLKRTRETADIIASGSIAEPEVKEADDAKTWNLGILAGTRKRYGRPAVQRLIENPEEAPLGGESYNTFKGRFIPWFKARAAEVVRTGDPILIVCSGSNLRCIGKALFDDEDCLDLDEGGLVVLRRANGKWHDEVLCGAKTERQRTGQVDGRDADLQDGGKSAMDEALERGRPMT